MSLSSAMSPTLRTWSSFVRLRPAAFSIEASRMMASPMMNATTGEAPWRAGGAGSTCASAEVVGEERIVDVAASMQAEHLEGV